MTLGPWWLRPLVLSVGVLSFVALLVTLLYGHDLEPPRASDTDSLSTGPNGHHAFVAWLRAEGLHVEQQTVADHAQLAPLFFIEPTQDEVRLRGDLLRLSEVIAQRREKGRPTVVVLPKWRRDPLTGLWDLDEQRQKTVLQAALGEGASQPDVIRRRKDDNAVVGVSGPLGAYTVTAPALQLLSWEEPPDDVEILAGAPGGALIVRSGSVIVVSDPDLLHSFNLHREAHADLLLALLSSQNADTAVIDEVFHGHGRELSLGRALGRFPMILAVLNGVALLLLFAWAGAVRVGPIVAAPRRMGRGPAQVIMTAASVLVASRSPGWIASAFAARLIADLARRLGVQQFGHAQDAEVLAEEVDALARRRGKPARCAELLVDARTLEHHRGSRTAARDFAREFWTYRRLMLSTQNRERR